MRNVMFDKSLYYLVSTTKDGTFGHLVSKKTGEHFCILLKEIHLWDEPLGSITPWCEHAHSAFYGDKNDNPIFSLSDLKKMKEADVLDKVMILLTTKCS